MRFSASSILALAASCFFFRLACKVKINVRNHRDRQTSISLRPGLCSTFTDCLQYSGLSKDFMLLNASKICKTQRMNNVSL